MGGEEEQKTVQNILLRCKNWMGGKGVSVVRKGKHKLGTSLYEHLGVLVISLLAFIFLLIIVILSLWICKPFSLAKRIKVCWEMESFHHLPIAGNFIHSLSLSSLLDLNSILFAF